MLAAMGRTRPLLKRSAGGVPSWSHGDLREAGDRGQGASPGAGHMEGNRGSAATTAAPRSRRGRSRAGATDIPAGLPLGFPAGHGCAAAAFGTGSSSLPAGPSQQPELPQRWRALPGDAGRRDLG